MDLSLAVSKQKIQVFYELCIFDSCEKNVNLCNDQFLAGWLMGWLTSEVSCHVKIFNLAIFVDTMKVIYLKHKVPIWSSWKVFDC